MKQPDYFVLGDYNAACFECGRKRKASQLKKHWRGYFVCPEHWEPRQPQDFVGTQPAQEPVPWAQPEMNTFVAPFPEPDPYDPNDP
jgi:hypothetical protein